MERQRFCVYNQTNECFLSLGVTVADAMPGRIKELITKSSAPRDEGLWVVPSQRFRAVSLRMAYPIDLLYLDRNYRVIHLVESSHNLHIGPLRMGAASVLALPVHTIYASQTRPGNQLVICVAEALEFRLKSAAGGHQPNESYQLETGEDRSLPAANSPEPGKPEERRKARRQINPRLVVFDWNGDKLAIHGIRDASTTGLFLLTEKRWPLGTLVEMSLQRPVTAGEDAGPSIAVQLEVVRCSADGVGLRFVLPRALEPSKWIEAEPDGN